MEERLHSNFGYGIGLAHKEDACIIAEGNQTVIEKGMTLHVRVTLKDKLVKGDKGKELTMAAIGDTVLVDESGEVVNLTSKVSAKYGSITYMLDDEEDENNSGKEN